MAESRSIMLVNAAEPPESRIAVLQDSKLVAYYTESETVREAAGNIYKGIVESIEPGLQAAFVNIGGGHNGFLQAENVVVSLRKKRRFFPFPRKKKEVLQEPERRNIKELLRNGDAVLVQITKEAIGEKGPSLTMNISIPGRYIVITPKSPHKGVSRKIEDETQRQKLRELIEQVKLPDGVGAIIRTAGEGHTLRDIERDADYLLKLWHSIEESFVSSTAPKLLYAESSLSIRAARDIFTPEINEVLVDSEEVFNRIREFFLTAMPRYSSRVRLYNGSTPIFEEYGVEEQIEDIYRREIALPDGGSIVIDETEALVAIDVNSGSFKRGNEEDTAFRVNMRAADEITKQLKLRDLGGLIVIDFIDMSDKEHIRQLEHRMRTNLRHDKAKTDIGRMSRFGTMEITRQRLRPSKQHLSYDRCPSCAGTGRVRTNEAVALRALRKVKAFLSRNPSHTLRVILHPDVAQYLQNRMRREIVALEDKFSSRIIVNSDFQTGVDEVKVGQL